MFYVIEVSKNNKQANWGHWAMFWWTFFLSKFIRRRNVIFKIDGLTVCCNESSIEVNQNKEQVFVQKYVEWSDIPAEYIRDILLYGQYVWNDLESKINQGGELWILKYYGNFAGIAISSYGKHLKPCYLLLSPEDIIISHCVIFEKYRGKGLYSTLLKNITVQQAKSNEQVEMYISCLDWNIPSIKGIQRAGFKFIGFVSNEKTIKYTKETKLPWLCNG